MDLTDSTVSEPHGAEFLDLLENKHNHVLTELDALNERIEQVLNSYAQGRTTATGQIESTNRAA